MDIIPTYIARNFETVVLLHLRPTYCITEFDNSKKFHTNIFYFSYLQHFVVNFGKITTERYKITCLYALVQSYVSKNYMPFTEIVSLIF